MNELNLDTNDKKKWIDLIILIEKKGIIRIGI